MPANAYKEVGSMRKARIKEECGAFYHCFSRVVDRRRIFDTSEKHKFRGLMRAMEGLWTIRKTTAFADTGRRWEARPSRVRALAR